MRMRRVVSIAVCFGLALVGRNVYGQSLAQDWPFAGHGSVSVDNPHGSLEVIGWSESRVQLRGEMGAGASLHVVRASPSQLRLAIVHDDDRPIRTHPQTAPVRRSDNAARLVLHVPHSVALTLTGVSVDVTVRSIRTPARITVNTISGDQLLSFTALAARLKSVSGDVRISGAAARSELSTISGKVDIQHYAGGVSASVVSGNLRVRDSSLAVLDIVSVSGDVDVAAAPLPKALWQIESVGGDIDLRLTDSPRVAIAADTTSGVVDSDTATFHKVARARKGARTTRTLRLDPPRAQARIVADSFSGDIRIHRLP